MRKLHIAGMFAGILLVLVAGCSEAQENGPLSLTAYRAWCADPANGLVQSRSVDGLKLTVRYQPPAMLAWLRVQRRPGLAAVRDSLEQAYARSRNFTLTLEADTAKGARGDVILRGIGTYAEFAQRLESMHFAMQQHIGLKTDDARYRPVLAIMDAAQGLSPRRTINLAFAPPDSSAAFYNTAMYDVVYDDRIFGTGIHHFRFPRERLEGVPALRVRAAQVPR